MLSPDESRLLAFSPGIASIVEVGQPGRVPLPRGVRWFAWSADGQRVVGIRQRTQPYSQDGGASAEREVPATVVEASADGAGGLTTRAELAVPYFLNPQDISRDETLIVGQDGARITILRADGDAASAEPVRFLVHNATQSVHGARFSPDGRWVVFEDATESNPGALYVQPLRGPGRRQQIAAQGRYAEWRGDGKEIVFRVRDDVWSVPVTGTGDNPSFGPAVRLFAGLNFAGGTTVASRSLAISRDGTRIFLVQRIDQREPNVIHVKTAAVQ